MMRTTTPSPYDAVRDAVRYAAHEVKCIVESASREEIVYRWRVGVGIDLAQLLDGRLTRFLPADAEPLALVYRRPDRPNQSPPLLYSFGALARIRRQRDPATGLHLAEAIRACAAVLRSRPAGAPICAFGVLRLNGTAEGVVAVLVDAGAGGGGGYV